MASQCYKLSVTPQTDILSNRCSPSEQHNLTTVYIFQLEFSSPWSAHPPAKCKKIQLKMKIMKTLFRKQNFLMAWVPHHIQVCSIWVLVLMACLYLWYLFHFPLPHYFYLVGFYISLSVFENEFFLIETSGSSRCIYSRSSKQCPISFSR